MCGLPYGWCKFACLASNAVLPEAEQLYRWFPLLCQLLQEWALNEARLHLLYLPDPGWQASEVPCRAVATLQLQVRLGRWALSLS